MEYQNADQGHALDWDDEVSDEGGFVLLEPGVYPFVVASVEKGRYEGGAKIGPCPKANVTLGVMTDSGIVDVRDSLLLHSRTAWRVALFFEALGFEKNPETGKVPMAWNRVEGRQGYAEIKVREYAKRDGGTGRSNEVDRYVMPKDWPAQQQQQQTAQPAQQAPVQTQPMFAQPAQPQHPGWSM